MLPPRRVILVRASLFCSSAPDSNNSALPHLSGLDFELHSVDCMASLFTTLQARIEKATELLLSSQLLPPRDGEAFLS